MQVEFDINNAKFYVYFATLIFLKILCSEVPF